MGSIDASLLAIQLAQLGRDLQEEVLFLGRLEEESADAEARFRKLKEDCEDDSARAFLAAEGGVEVRKCIARLEVAQARVAHQEAEHAWKKLQGRVRTQQASLQALHRRIEVGRSLLSREKSLISLENSGISALWTARPVPC